MDQDTVINLASQAMSLAFKVAGPLLLGAMIVGLVVSIFQAVTQIQEQSLTLIPKIATIAAITVLWARGCSTNSSPTPPTSTPRSRQSSAHELAAA